MAFCAIWHSGIKRKTMRYFYIVASVFKFTFIAAVSFGNRDNILTVWLTSAGTVTILPFI